MCRGYAFNTAISDSVEEELVWQRTRVLLLEPQSLQTSSYLGIFNILVLLIACKETITLHYKVLKIMQK